MSDIYKFLVTNLYCCVFSAIYRLSGIKTHETFNKGLFQHNPHTTKHLSIHLLQPPLEIELNLTTK